jgi:hypothetical protein
MKFITKALGTLACLSVLSFSALEAADNGSVEAVRGWRLSIGMSYRDFDAPDFKKVSLPADLSFVPFGGGSSLSYSELASTVAAGPVGVQRFTASRSLVSYGAAASYTAMEGFAPVIGAALDIWQEDALTLSLAGNFQFFSMNSAANESALEQSKVIRTVNFGSVAAVPTEDDIISDRTDAWIDGVSGGGKKKFAMDLYVFDFGLSLNYVAAENLQVFVAAGPTLSIADMESSNGLGKSKNEVEFEYGVYASCGGTYWFTERFGLCAELRYDNCFGTVGTRFVKQDLDSTSGLLKLVVNF